jgi:hypothetical protein
MDSILLPEPLAVANHGASAGVAHRSFSFQLPCLLVSRPRRGFGLYRSSGLRRSLAIAATGTLMANSVPVRYLLRCLAFNFVFVFVNGIVIALGTLFSKIYILIASFFFLFCI